MSSRSVQRLIQVVQDVVDGLEAHGEPDVVVGDARGLLLVHRELRVGRRGGVYDQALRVAHVGKEAVQLEPVYKALASLEATFDAEAEDRTVEPIPVVLRRQVVRRMVREAGEVYPGHLWMTLQELGDGLRVRRVALHPEWQRLEALQEQEAVERAQGRTVVSEHLDPGLQDKGKLTQRRVDLQSVVGWVWFGEPRELPVVPGELAAVHYDAADGRTVPPDELGRRVDDYVGPVL